MDLGQLLQDVVKVRKSRKQIVMSSILPKTNEKTCLVLKLEEFCSPDSCSPDVWKQKSEEWGSSEKSNLKFSKPFKELDWIMLMN